MKANTTDGASSIRRRTKKAYKVSIGKRERKRHLRPGRRSGDGHVKTGYEGVNGFIWCGAD